MEQQKTTVQRTGTHIGLLTGLAAIVYHLFLYLTGLSDITSLHFLTGIILIIGVCMAIKRHKTVQNGRIGYLEGVGVGFFVGLVSSAVYTIAQVIGDYVFDMAYSYPYMLDDRAGEEPAIWLIAMTWILFGVVIGPFTAYLAMQYFKNPDHKLTS